MLMEPPAWASSGRAAWAQRIVAVRLTSTTSRNTSSSYSARSRLIPAQQMRVSSRDSSPKRDTSESGSRTSSSVRRTRGCWGGWGGRRFVGAQSHGVHVGAELGKPQRGGRPDAGGPPGDDDGSSGEQISLPGHCASVSSNERVHDVGSEAHRVVVPAAQVEVVVHVEGACALSALVEPHKWALDDEERPHRLVGVVRDEGVTFSGRLVHERTGRRCPGLFEVAPLSAEGEGEN